MSLFDLHSHPETLKYYDKRFMVPEIAFKEARRLWTEEHKRKDELEIALAKDFHWAYLYAFNVINQRFLLAEPTIAKDPHSAYMYASVVVKGRWVEGELAIAENAFVSTMYAKHVLKDRFPLGEPAIKNCGGWKQEYEKHFEVKI